MRLTFLLADYAQQLSGKLYTMGAGWNVTGPDPAPSSLAGIVHVSWDESNQRHRAAFDLFDADGHAFMVPTPMGMQPLHVEIAFEVGRPAGVAVGSEFNVPFAINMVPLALEPGQRYEWRPKLDEQEVISARLAFTVRPRPVTVVHSP